MFLIRLIKWKVTKKNEFECKYAISADPDFEK